MWRATLFLTGLMMVLWIGVAAAETTQAGRIAPAATTHWVAQGGSTDHECGESSDPCGQIELALQDWLQAENHVANMKIFVRPGIYEGFSPNLSKRIPDTLQVIAVDANDVPCTSGSTCSTIDPSSGSAALYIDAYTLLPTGISHNITLTGFDFQLNSADSVNLPTAMDVIPDEETGDETITLTLNNVVLHDYNGARGLRVREDVTANMNNCTVRDNQITSSFNGAVTVEQGGSLNVDTCTFRNNDNVSASGGGAAITSSGAVAINRGNFMSNTVTSGSGGAIYSTESLDIDNSVFEQNSAGTHGGAIYAYCAPASGATECDAFARTKLDVRNSSFALNSAGDEGGAISANYIRNVILIDVGVDQNSAVRRGGGLNLEYIPTTLLLNRVDITNNSLSDIDSRGGGVYIESAFEILNGSISGNTSRTGGGAYLLGLGYGSLSKNLILNTTISNNTTFGGAGSGVYLTDANVTNALETTLDNVTFSGNRNFFERRSQASADSGAADSGANTNGGALFIDSAFATTVRDSSFLGNRAGLFDGGAIVITASGSHNIIDTPFANNAAYNCGAIDNAATLTLIRSSFVSNSAGDDDTGGGAICNSGSLTMLNGRIGQNSAAMGGGIYNSGTLVLIGMTLDGNTVSNVQPSLTGSGGAIWNSGELTMANSTVSGNSAENNGGGLYNTGTTNINFSTITNNTADSEDANAGNGGGLYLDGGTVTLSNSILAANLDASSGQFDLSMPDCGTVLSGGDTLNSAGYNVIGFSNCAIGGDTTGNQIGSSVMLLDPQLSPLDSNGGSTQTHLPANSSPAVNNVSDTSRCTGLFVNLDQRGFTRPADSGCDSGAVEIDGVPTAVAISGQPSAVKYQPMVVFAWLTMLLGAQLIAVLAKRTVGQKRH